MFNFLTTSYPGRKTTIFPLFDQFAQLPHCEKSASKRIKKILIVSRLFNFCYMTHFISLNTKGFQFDLCFQQHIPMPPTEAILAVPQIFVPYFLTSPAYLDLPVKEHLRALIYSQNYSIPKKLSWP